MEQSYLDRIANGPGLRTSGAAIVAEPAGSMSLARELIAQLLPDHDADRLIRALLAEREYRLTHGVERGYDADIDAALRELTGMRAQLALGGAALTLQHAFSNPLTALLAEAQLLSLEPMPEGQRAAVGRILELARRLVVLSRRLGGE
ncbi:MAG: hypothetical protein V4550_00120 [Gemmatimonadota bacterium]